MYTIVTAPASEPLSATDVKNYLKVDHSEDDDLIDIMIQAAREYCEKYTGRALITQTIDEYYDIFPATSTVNPRGGIELRFAPISSVTSVTYVASDEEDFDNYTAFSNYREDLITEPGRLFPEYNYSWPDTLDLPNAVKIRYVAGYSSASDVPAQIRQAMLLIIAKMYESREDTVKKMPTHAQWLLQSWKIPHVSKII